ncbi:hypothetical protein [Candidatus Hydrogenosomobacter endosymbioticus]|uniref:Uncharacterized protein n=1 Tax=Candidatus Hydrogenosomobacter endosymbioticus TaxID=2558174 RepID=A0ABN6L3M6_9PROT|nr:hypothetical protein [Candidatus Hydrogenosomobacter endosymbioticus]BDB96473.1 hypothetical protein HYD_6060 [Candidatus Hydrogenosomobacter endosymbioticus]
MKILKHFLATFAIASAFNVANANKDPQVLQKEDFLKKVLAVAVNNFDLEQQEFHGFSTTISGITYNIFNLSAHINDSYHSEILKLYLADKQLLNDFSITNFYSEPEAPKKGKNCHHTVFYPSATIQNKLIDIYNNSCGKSVQHIMEVEEEFPQNIEEENDVLTTPVKSKYLICDSSNQNSNKVRIEIWYQ